MRENLENMTDKTIQSLQGEQNDPHDHVFRKYILINYLITACIQFVNSKVEMK